MVELLLDAVLPPKVTKDGAEWFTETHISKIYKFGDLALKSIVPKPYIQCNTLSERREVLTHEYRTGLAYNSLNKLDIFKGVVTRKNESDEDEAYLVMQWLDPNRRVDYLLKKGDFSKENVYDIVLQITTAHKSIPPTGDEIRYASCDGLMKAFYSDTRVTQNNLKMFGLTDAVLILSTFVKTYTKLVDKIGHNYFLKRIGSGYVKFAANDTKSDNIYIINSKPVFLDPAVINLQWCCCDVVYELASFSASLIEESKLVLLDNLINFYRDNYETNFPYQMFWLHVSFRLYLKAFVALEHAKLKKDRETDLLKTACTALALANEYIKRGITPEFLS